MNMKRALLILGATLIASAPVQAALSIDTYTNKALWEAAVSGQVVEDFNFEATGSFVTRSFPGFTVLNENPADLDTEVRDGADSANVNGTNFLYYYSVYNNTDGMIIDLVKPTQALGFNWRNIDPTGDTAAMEIIVDGQTFVFGPPGSGFFGIVVTNAGGFSTVRVRDTVGGGQILEGLGLDDFTFVDAEVALFKVTKDFTPFSTAPVDVTLTCDKGHPLDQTATINGGDPEGVTFVLEHGVGADCVVTESGSDGYATTMIPAACTFNNINDVNYRCRIQNTAKPVTFGFTKVWDHTGTGGLDMERFSRLTVYCNNDIVADSGNSSGTLRWRRWESSSKVSSKDYWVKVSATSRTTPRCYVDEDAQDSAIEVTQYGACGSSRNWVTIPIGESRTSCTFTNTVFFEGIPTLSQYGMAIMALLMLGIGFIGFRRFV